MNVDFTCYLIVLESMSLCLNINDSVVFEYILLFCMWVGNGCFYSW